MSTLAISQAFAVPGEHHVIDAVHPVTGRGLYSDETLEQVCQRHPGAVLVRLDDWCTARAQAQRSPITWHSCTEEAYDRSLGCLPPAARRGGAFLVGEPHDHDAGNGQPRYPAFRTRGETYEQANRPMTCAEFETARRQP